MAVWVECRVRRIAQGGASTVFEVLEDPRYLASKSFTAMIHYGTVLKVLKQGTPFSMLDSTVELQFKVKLALEIRAVDVPEPLGKVVGYFIADQNEDCLARMSMDATIQDLLLEPVEQTFWTGHIERRIHFLCELKPKSPLPLSSRHKDTRFNLSHPPENRFDYWAFFQHIVRGDRSSLKTALVAMKRQNRLHLVVPESERLWDQVCDALIECKETIFWLYKHTALCEGVAREAYEISRDGFSTDGRSLDEFLLSFSDDTPEGVVHPFLFSKEPIPDLSLDNLSIEEQVLDALATACTLKDLVAVMRLNEQLASQMASAKSDSGARRRFISRFFLGRILSDVSILIDSTFNCFLIDFDASKPFRKLKSWAETVAHLEIIAQRGRESNSRE
eukprot:Protomagalhaensia_sp_Gyna_25__4643@NODE_431_length_3458_cov_55_269377_g332_i0_p2_GENE_NODE_431_length_3458_cov_55_269377_g332_i0NODE_431_length_3458_cov_55_269377_g332_i0_p2_ORF_typecomplete_len390_score46_39Ins_P5_2kin/PF06090_12/7_6e08_NODE_431_length_3458_cov_55_269377_g332_i017762945